MSNFIKWLKNSNFIVENNIKGDISRDIINDSDFPNSDDKDIIFSYMSTKFYNHNDLHFLEEFKEIFLDFLNNQ